MAIRNFLLTVLGTALVSIVVGLMPALAANFVLNKGDWYSWPSLVIIGYGLLVGSWVFSRIMKGVPGPSFNFRFGRKTRTAEAQ